MLRYRFVFRVEMLRYRFVFRVEMLSYRFVFRVEMLRYRFVFRVEMQRYRFVFRVETLCFGNATLSLVCMFSGWKCNVIACYVIALFSGFKCLSRRRRTRRPGRIYIYIYNIDKKEKPLQTGGFKIILYVQTFANKV